MRSIGCALAAFSLIVWLSGASTQAADTAGQIVWHGIVLGTPASKLKATFGDPLRITQGNDERVARYWIPGDDATFFLITEQRGYIFAFHAFTTSTPIAALENVPADPSGVHLGDTIQTVEQLHPSFKTETGDQGEPMLIGPGPLPDTAVIYDFDQGRVHSFAWQMEVPAGLPALPMLTEPDGSSMSNAIVDVQSDEFAGVHWEYLFIAFQPCDGNTAWRPSGEQALLSEHQRTYDRDHVVCPTTKAERDYYFDISSYFGKL